MAINFDKVAERIFEIVKSRGHIIKLYKENGEVALNPATEARRFWLEEDDIMVSLIQQGEDSEIKMYVGENKSIKDIESLLQNLRTLAGRFGLLFNVRKYGKELQPKHFAFLAHQAQEEEKEMNESHEFDTDVFLHNPPGMDDPRRMQQQISRAKNWAAKQSGPNNKIAFEAGKKFAKTSGFTESATIYKAVFKFLDPTFKVESKMNEHIEYFYEGIEDWDVGVSSIPKSDEERAKWPSEDDICPKCYERFGSTWGNKMVKDVIDGKRVAVHKRCSDGSYLGEARDVTRLRGTSKSSHQNIGKPTRLIVKHTGAVDETKFASRARNIGKIFIETHEGERLKFPVPYLQGGRAMARHMSEGGEWNDDIGAYIRNECTEYGAMKTFRKHNKGINEETMRITGIVKERIAEIALEMKKIQGPRSYRHFRENFEAKPNQLDESLLEFEINRLRGIFESDLDNSVYETIARLTSNEDTEKAMTAEAVISKIHNLIEDGDIKFAPRFAANPKFESKRARAAHIAADLSERVNDGDIAGFLSELSDRITTKGETTIRENEALIKLHELSRSAIDASVANEPLKEFSDWADSEVDEAFMWGGKPNQCGKNEGKAFVMFHGNIEGPFRDHQHAYKKFGRTATWIKSYDKLTPREQRHVDRLGEDSDEELAKDMAGNPGLRDRIRKNPKKELGKYTKER